MNFLKKILQLIFNTSSVSTKEKEPKPMLLNIEQLFEINERKNRQFCEQLIGPLNECFIKYKVDTNLRIAHFLSQVIHESGNLKLPAVENLNYSSAALLTTWPRHFTQETANRFGRSPLNNNTADQPGIANTAYANRMSNGPFASGDGWAYRGRGLIQLTGRANYTLFNETITQDVIKNPDLVANPDLTVESAFFFWTRNNLNRFADADDILGLTKAINGGTKGLDHRTQVLGLAKIVFGI